MALSLLAISTVDPLLLVGGVLLGLLGLLSLVNRRIRGGGAGSRESVALTGSHAVHVVEIGGRRLLLGTGPSGAPRLLAELGEVELAAEHPSTGGPLARPWAELLDRFGGVGGR